MKTNHLLRICISFFALALFGLAPGPQQAAPGAVVLLDRDRKAVTRLTDGNRLQLQVTLETPVNASTPVAFQLAGDGAQVAECSLAANQKSCTTSPFDSLGWYWTQSGQARPHDQVQAVIGASIVARSTSVEIAPRPVVMVHGFSSDWTAWKNYLGPDGYLASAGLHGYAVGDGQVPGVLNTGNLAQPTGRTNTIAENAAILGTYIDNVEQETGAEKVDLIAHSMGGLIARYYIDRVMNADVSQLMMLGSPMAGTDCADLPASLGLYLPAALEIQPSYVINIFNPQITRRHGLAFYALAGDPIQKALQSPCTDIPTDIAVALDSVSAIPVHLEQMPVLHTELNTSQEVFTQFVLPKLQTPPGKFVPEPDPPAATTAPIPLQFSRTFTGHLDPGESQEVTIQIDPGIRVANFALFDTTQSITVTVRGASGNLIQLSAARNGLMEIDDPSTMVYLGYGFENPKPGAWRITLSPSDRTPAAGADYAIQAAFRGGAELHLQSSQLLPRLQEPVQFSAQLSLAGQALPLLNVQAELTAPDGRVETLPVSISNGTAQSTWQPSASGLYRIAFDATGQAPDGASVERSAVQVIEVQPASGASPRTVLLILVGVIAVILIGLAVLGMGAWVLIRRRRHKPG